MPIQASVLAAQASLETLRVPIAVIGPSGNGKSQSLNKVSAHDGLRNLPLRLKFPFRSITGCWISWPHVDPENFGRDRVSDTTVSGGVRTSIPKYDVV